jgi:tripartite ATP-independent transporter DctM subunit
MAGVHWTAIQRNMPRDDSVKWKHVPRIIARGLLPLSLPVVLLTGIYTGAFTPTEAAAVAALHALILAGVVYRAFDWKGLFAVTLESVRASTIVTVIIASAYLMNYVFTAEGVPIQLANWVNSLGLTQIQFLLLVNALFLILGCFLDVSVMLLVFVPMLVPAAKLLGIDLVHFGVVVIVNMMIGLTTPPFGMLLFVTNALTGIPLKDMIREGWLFVGLLMTALLLFTFVPQTVLWLPQMMGYKTI